MGVKHTKLVLNNQYINVCYVQVITPTQRNIKQKQE